MIGTTALRSERSFLGAVINGDAKATGYSLKASDFGDSFLRNVFTACAQLEVQGKTADLVTLSDCTDLDAIALVELAAETKPDGALAGQHADNIRGLSRRRRVAEACIKAAQAAQDGSLPLEDTSAKLRAYLDKMSAQSDSDGTVAGIDALVEFGLWLDSKELEPAVPTGLSKLDMQLGGGLKGGRFYVIGARPGVGKSALMGNMAVHAIKKGYKALYVSLEMDAREIVTRMISSVSGVTIGNIWTRSIISIRTLKNWKARERFFRKMKQRLGIDTSVMASTSERASGKPLHRLAQWRLAFRSLWRKTSGLLSAMDSVLSPAAQRSIRTQDCLTLQQCTWAALKHSA